MAEESILPSESSGEARLDAPSDTTDAAVGSVDAGDGRTTADSVVHPQNAIPSPSPGWYTDPSGQPGLRWWDGLRWTSTTSQDFAAKQSPIESHSEWLRESVRVGFRRFGNFMPLVVTLLLPLNIIFSVALWNAINTVVIEIDEATGTITVENWEWTPALAVAGALLIAMLLAMAFFRSVVAHQTAAGEVDKPNSWSASVRHSLQRAPRLFGGVALRALVLWGLLIGWVLAVTINIFFVLLAMVVFPAMIFLWFRLSVVDIASSLGVRENSPLQQSWRASGAHPLAYMGALLLAIIVGFFLWLFVNSVLGGVFMGIAEQGRARVSENQTFALIDIVGSTPQIAALGAFFAALGAGIRNTLTATGMTLIYQRVGGSVDESIFELENNDEPS